MKVLVTGCSGLIGKRLVEDLVKSQHEVLGIDITKSPLSSRNFSYEHCNILNLEKLDKIFFDFKPDALVHLAARIDLDEKKDLNGYASNIEGVRNLVKVVQDCKSLSRCIYTSSQLVCKVGYIPESYDDYQPNTLYGQSKVLTEKIVKDRNSGGVTWCITRPTTVWGPGMSPHYQKFIKMIHQGKYFHVGQRPLYKSYSYVGNISYQYIKLLTVPAEKINQQIFYLADYTPISLRKWTDSFQIELGAKPIPSYPIPLVISAAKVGDLVNAVGFRKFPFNSFRLNNILTEYVFDLSKTEAVCGSLPYTVDEGVRETVKWLKESKAIS